MATAIKKVKTDTDVSCASPQRLPDAGSCVFAPVIENNIKKKSLASTKAKYNNLSLGIVFQLLRVSLPFSQGYFTHDRTKTKANLASLQPTFLFVCLFAYIFFYLYGVCVSVPAYSFL